MDLIRSISWATNSHLRHVRDDDSYIDRLSHRYTVAICVLFAIIVSTKQYAGDPIDCWVPAQFKASYEKYADSYCWIAGSWYTPMDRELPLNERERRSQRIRYYQWVPFLLLFQAILCYVPRIIWRSFNVKSGLDLVNLIDAAIKYESVEKFTDREKIMAYIVRNIERYIGARKSRYESLYGRQHCYSHTGLQTSANMPIENKGCCSRFGTKLRIVCSTLCFWTGRRLGNYLAVLYMFVKTLWLTNAVSQLFLINRFIGNDYHAFGLEIIEMLLSGQEWHELRHFPRVTYCDFKIREIGNQHDWTVQCVLRINLFNEVIYIFMWFWLCILALCSLVDYCSWSIRLLMASDKIQFIKRHLDIYSNYLPNERDKQKKLMKDFTFNYLKDDGIFAMRIMASNASDLIVTEIMSELWKNYRTNISNDNLEHNKVSPSNSTSSSTTTSNPSSSTSSPVNQFGTTLPKNSSSNNSNSSIPHSPTTKKPFMNSGSNIKIQYSPTHQHHINQKQNQTLSDASIQSTPALTAPAQSKLNLNQLNCYNHSSDDSYSLKKPLNNNNENKEDNNPSLFPQLYSQNQRVSFNLEHHSNVNPNSKDTHV